MSRILGTDGHYNAWGKPTIILEQADDDCLGERIYIALFAALLFSNGFHVDAAWLGYPPLKSSIEAENGSFRRLLDKGFIRLISRMPLEDIQLLLPKSDALSGVLEALPIWSWPAAREKPKRSWENEDDEFITFEPASHKTSFVTTRNGLAYAQSVDDLFVEVPMEKLAVTPSRNFGAVVSTLGDLNCLSMRGSMLNRFLLASTKADILNSLNGKQLSDILGSAGRLESERSKGCRHMLEVLSKTKSQLNRDTVDEVAQIAREIARLLGIRLCSCEAPDSIALSLQDALGFVLCWR